MVHDHEAYGIRTNRGGYKAERGTDTASHDDVRAIQRLPARGARTRRSHVEECSRIGHRLTRYSDEWSIERGHYWGWNDDFVSGVGDYGILSRIGSYVVRAGSSIDHVLALSPFDPICRG